MHPFSANCKRTLFFALRIKWLFLVNILKKRLIKYIENSTTSDKKILIFFSYLSSNKKKNEDCGYSLEPPRLGGSNEYPYLWGFFLFVFFFCKIRKMMYSSEKKNNRFIFKSGVYGGQYFTGVLS